MKKELKLVEGRNDDIKFISDIPNTQVARTNQTTAIHVLANLLAATSVEAIREVQDDREGRIVVTLEAVRRSPRVRGLR